jgi:hypothetical protein
MKSKMTRPSSPKRTDPPTADASSEIDDDAIEDAELNAICDERQHEVAIEVDFEEL